MSDLYDSSPDQVIDVIVAQAATTGKAGRPALTVFDVLDGLAGWRAIRFAHRVRADLMKQSP